MKKGFWSGEKLLSATALLVSVCTLVVFLYQTNLIRKQQYMSVFPYVTMGNAGSETINYKYIVENDGIGPALIKSVKILDGQGKKYDDLVDYVRDNVSETDSMGFYYANIRKGRLIPEKEFIEVIGISDKKFESAELLSSLLNSEGLLIEIEYESIYGETWVVTNISSFPVKK